MNDARLVLRLPPTTLRAATERARRDGLPLAMVVRSLLGAYARGAIDLATVAAHLAPMPEEAPSARQGAPLRPPGAGGRADGLAPADALLAQITRRG